MTRRLVVPVLVLAACGGTVAARPPVVAVPLPVASAVQPPPAPSAGSACTPGRKLECAGPGSAVICREGAIATIVCRGPRGCRGQGDEAKCDDSIGDVGDACDDVTPGDNYACTPDQTREVRCAAGTFALWSACDGPKGCTTDGTLVRCDDSLGRVGGACAVAEGDEDYACSVDGTAELKCQKKGPRVFAVYHPCRGPKHCWVDADRVHCDQSAGREGEPCGPVDNHTCSEDGRSELKCAPEKVWVGQKRCPRSGCRIQDNDVRCE